MNSNLVEFGGLLAPQSYVNATDDEKSDICNGCGTSGWKGKVVPETMWGLDISEACQRHDWMYHYGTTKKDKELADLVFLRNLVRIINREGGWLKWPRRYRAMTYYNFVADFGDEAFWDNKQVML